MTTRQVLTALLMLQACATLIPSASLSKTWIVDINGGGDFAKVQSGINAAQTGDSVLVAPGTYVENIRFAGRDIVLKSQAGPEMTVLDGSGQDRSVVEFFNGETQQCRIEGFTITRGRGSAIFVDEKVGGGILVQDSEPTIMGNRIVGNTAISSLGYGAGGGIFCRAGHPDQFAPLRTPHIIANVISANIAGANAAGIGLQEKMSAIIADNIISQNQTQLGDGAGIWILVRRNPEILISGNTIHNNDASDHGAGIYAANSFHDLTPPLLVRIVDNLIYGNLARGRARTGDSGGGIWLNCTDASVISNTIVANQGQGPGNSYGGGIVMLRPASPNIERNIIALSVQGGGVLCRQGATPTMTDNLVWSNDGGDALGNCTGWVGTNGNIQADPLFCNAAKNDFSLPPNSPAFLHPAGLIGAIAMPGCKVGVSIESTTWGAIKAWRRK